MVKALVVGGNGFIGSALVDALAKAGFDVAAFDRFSSRGPAFSAPNVKVIAGDFLNRADIATAVQGQDYVFHFLSTTTPASAQADPTLDIRTNIEPSVHLLEACVHAGVQRFFYASTGGAIYGDQNQERFNEDDLTLPVSPYAIGKLAVENYLSYFSKVSQLSSFALRISNPYGSGQPVHKKQGLIPIAIRQGITGKTVQQFGDGSMVRDYIFVDDLVDMITTIALSDPQYPVYNLGSGRGSTVTEVFDSISAALKVPLNIEVRDAPSTYVDRVVLDISRYESEYGVPKFTSLAEGILKTIEALRTTN